jgi:para-nitrobenzyl esterase
MNIFMPDTFKEGELRPLMVKIHGGGFVAGSAGQAWNQTRVTGSVIIEIQYRLGVLGFFSASSPPPNFGMMDQQMALMWVRRNAAILGGSPDHVMIYGCSAGGASVAGHLVMPGSFGLYSAAGLESPGGHQGWMGDEKRTDDDWMSARLNVRHSQMLTEQLNCSLPSLALRVECLQKVSLGDFYPLARHLRFAPALSSTDGEDVFPLGLIRVGKWNHVPTLVGGASCESCHDALKRLGPPSTVVSKEAFDSALIKYGLSGVNGSGVGPDTLETWYAHRIASEGRWRTFARILGDSGHSCSAALHAEALASSLPTNTNNSNIWRYFFDVHSFFPGATHCSQEAWVTQTYPTKTKEELLLEQALGFWWSSLAAHGNPNTNSKPGVPTWPMYTTTNPVALVISSTTPYAGSSDDTRRVECNHWKPFLGWEVEARRPASAVYV